MMHYQKTESGIQALQQRSMDLNARQRRLLLLIGTDDFQLLNPLMKQKLASPELIEQLEALGLIIHLQKSDPYSFNQTASSESHEIIRPTKDVVLNHYSHDQSHQTATTSHQSPAIGEIKPTEVKAALQPAHSSTVAPHPEMMPGSTSLSFEQIQQLMCQQLKQYCGLMAHQLILQIQQAKNIQSIKLCQMQWITALQETRIAPQQLNQCMQQINQSLQQLIQST